MHMLENSIKATYENLSVVCEHCGQTNLFNRATDLPTLEPISGLDVVCMNKSCGKTFRIYGDTINPAFEMLVFDCAELYRVKHYASCIVNLTQAWETFFANYLRVELAYRRYALDDDLDKLNFNLASLYELSKRWTFGGLRNVFLNMCVEPIESVGVLSEKCAQYKSTLVREKLIDVKTDIRKLLEKLYDSEIGELRNKIVHKSAYRPHKNEVDKYFKETSETLFPLGHKLGIRGDDVNWYVNIEKRRHR